MAQQIQNARGTLTPGQTISVNKYTVQVDRYLSQGGFAHVYLVRTAAPVYGTTHHVLKRIAVSNDSMLTDVKKEVDIMRILKGHPNIVHLIDAAWHRLSNGTYEVFILMEFCPGGGIIDMMNRRLRERLTEAEILNIFVDVCEGVAAMHNLRPALLHRDLKVENILQASATSYKLCDFGSATSVSPKPPSTTQEIRALEADLNRHTTLQYRAPEMVDPYLRRPVDEKSDVWALGVLLYKLCYYTTPFEEHGPLAILNVQYRIPPYPVYSSQLNSMIASMLREHGTHRPSIFEILNVVHQFRGTQSRFTYQIPEKQPLSPRTTTSNFPSNNLNDLVTYQSPHIVNNSGTQAREKVLEAIAPMRRGRPTRGTSRSPSPSKEKTKTSWLDADISSKFSAQEDQAWKATTKAQGGAIRGHKSGVITSDAWKVKPTLPSNDGWEIKETSKVAHSFESDFSVNGFGDSFEVPALNSSGLRTSSRNATSASIPISARSPQIPSGALPSADLARLAPRSLKSKDAFEGLGLSEKPPAPTLGEVRKARTGLVIPLEQSFTPRRHTPQPPPSPRPSPRPPPTLSEQQQPESFNIEDRFPSLEELDRRIFGGADASHPPNAKPEYKALQEKSNPALSHTPKGATGGWRSTVDSGISAGVGYRSQNVTGTGMRDSKNAVPRRHAEPSFSSEWAGNDLSGSGNYRSSRPSPTRNHSSSTSTKQSSSSFEIAPELAVPAGLPIQGLAAPSTSSAAHDWLTGDDEAHASNILSRLQTDTTPGHDGEKEAPVLRESPSKRASFFEKSPHLIPEPLEGDVEQGELLPPPALPSRPFSNVTRTQPPLSLSSGRKSPLFVETGSPTSANTVTRGRDVMGDWNPGAPVANSRRNSIASSSDDDDEGPEDISEYGGSYRGKSSILRNIQRKDGSKSKRRQSSVHDLVDLWGGSTIKEKEKISKSDLAPKEQKRRSVILPSSTAVAATSSLAGLPRSSSPPQHPTSSPATPQRSYIRSRSRDANKQWKPPGTTSALSPPPLQKSTSSGPSPSTRSRPQSMLIFPTSKPILDNGLPSPGLEPPQGLRTISASRRTSISNMVHRYEGIGKQSPVVGSYTNIPPPISTKPAGLIIPNNESYTGPGSSNTRYTNISPLASPVKSMSSTLPIPAADDSHGVSSRRASPVGFSDRTSPRRSPVEYVRKKSNPTTTTNYSSGHSNTGWDDSSASGEPKSPSPEKAYAGVGRLIDQWQKKAEESGDGKKSGGTPAKRFGVGAR